MTDYNKIITTVNSITPDYQFIPDLNNTIVIDTSENRIGINTITPDENIHVSGGTIKTQDLIVLGDFSVNNVSSDILPRDDLSYNIGSITHRWKDLFIGSGSLYMDKTRILSMADYTRHNGALGHDISALVLDNSGKHLDISDIRHVNIQGDVSINKHVDIKEQLTALSDVSFMSKFYVEDDTSFNNRVDIEGRLLVIDDSSFNSQVDISGVLNIKKTISADGLTTTGTKIYTVYQNNSAGNITTRLIIDPASDGFLGDAAAQGEVVIYGNLDVKGTTTFIRSTNVDISDNIIRMNANHSSVSDGGIEVINSSNTIKRYTYSNPGNYWTTHDTGINIGPNGGIVSCGYANIDNVNIDANTISTDTGNLNINAIDNVVILPGTKLLIQKDTALTGNFTVSGTTALNSTLGVTGATTLSSSLGVNGTTTLNNTLGVTGATTLNSTLGVTGATTLNNTLAVTGTTTLNNTLGVTGATTLNSTLDVTGATTLSNTLDVTGATTLNSTLDVTGATTCTTIGCTEITSTVLTTKNSSSADINVAVKLEALESERDRLEALIVALTATVATNAATAAAATASAVAVSLAADGVQAGQLNVQIARIDVHNSRINAIDTSVAANLASITAHTQDIADNFLSVAYAHATNNSQTTAITANYNVIATNTANIAANLASLGTRSSGATATTAWDHGNNAYLRANSAYSYAQSAHDRGYAAQQTANQAIHPGTNINIAMYADGGWRHVGADGSHVRYRGGHYHSGGSPSSVAGDAKHFAFYKY